MAWEQMVESSATFSLSISLSLWKGLEVHPLLTNEQPARRNFDIGGTGKFMVHIYCVRT